MGYYALTPKKQVLPKPMGTPSKKVSFGANPHPANAVIMGMMPASDRTAVYPYVKMKDCPFCDTVLISVDRSKRRCMSCHQYIIFADETVQDVVKVRAAAGVYTVDIDTSKVPSRDIWIWDSEQDLYTRVYDAPFKAIDYAEGTL